MNIIKRVYVAGVGYTCYLTKAPESQSDLISYQDHIKASQYESGYTYKLNLKIGYSDLKQIDLTPYLSNKNNLDLEILVVGKEIISTPGYQDLNLEIESVLTASEIKSIIIIRGKKKSLVNSLAATIRNLRPFSVYKGIGLRLEGDALLLKTFVKSKH